MSLYGLDIIVCPKGHRYVNEINGVLSGMRGFIQVYGDNRVQERVFNMLQTKYGKLTLNDGSYSMNKFRRENPIKSTLFNLTLKIKFLRNFLFRPIVLSSKKAEIDWINDKTDNPNLYEYPFETYNGQESTVINSLNEELPHDLINSYVAEEITRNKFLQYRLLKNSEVNKNIIPSSLVGLGATNEVELSELISDYDNFVVKPILGSCGKGIQIITKKEIEKRYKYSRGPLDHVSIYESILAMEGKAPKIKYLEDMINKEDFSFELGVSIVQPFIDSRKTLDDKRNYSVVRAIVCNGNFVDAYLRISKNPRVNLSRDAKPIHFNYDSNFINFCEKVIKIFEERSQNYSSSSFRKILYNDYLEERGRTSERKRHSDAISPIMDNVVNIITNLRFFK